MLDELGLLTLLQLAVLDYFPGEVPDLFYCHIVHRHSLLLDYLVIHLF